MRALAAVPLVLVIACQDGPVFTKIDTDPVDPFDTDVASPALQPDIEVTPGELRFPSLRPQCSATQQVISISNVGEADLELARIELRGRDKIAYTVRLPKDPVLAPGETVDVKVDFTPQQVVPYDDVKVAIESNDPDEPLVRVALTGSGSVADFIENLFVQESQSNVDVLWAIDASGSMSEEVDQLKSKFDFFIDNFTNLGLSYRIAAVPADGSTSCVTVSPWIDENTADPVAAFEATVDAIFSGAAPFTGCYGEAGFLAARTTIEQHPDFLRDDATLAVIAVSDEKEQSNMSASDFATWLSSVKPSPDDVTFSAFVGPSGSSGGGGIFGDLFDECPGGSHPDAHAESAPKYHDAIRRTGGVWGDLCSFDIAPFLTHVSYVAAGLTFRFELTDIPTNVGPSAITVTVNGVDVPYGRIDGWMYDASTNSIVFYGDAIPAPGSEILVEYPFDSGCTP